MVGVGDQGTELGGAFRAIRGSIPGKGCWTAKHQSVTATRATHLLFREVLKKK